MKFGELSEFFASKLTDLKFKQWESTFSFQNIPANIFDRAFHITVGSGSGSPANSLVHEFKIPITVRAFFKGYRDPITALADGLNSVNDIYGAILKPSVRLQTDGLKDIRPTSMQPFAISQSNEHQLIVEIGFECFLIYKFN